MTVWRPMKLAQGARSLFGLLKLLVGARPCGSTRLRPWQAHGFACAATVAMLVLRLAIDSRLDGQPTLILFTLPITLSAYLGGISAGLLSTALSYLLASYFLLPPLLSLAVTSPVERLQLLFFVLAGVVISVLNEALHRARRRAGIATHEHEQAEGRLQPLKQSIAGMLEGIQIIDRKWRYVYVNAAAARHGRHAPADLVGRTMMECYPGIESTPLFDEMKIVMESGTARQVRNEFTFDAGTMGWFELSIEPDPCGILIRSMDITAHKQAEDALRKAGVLQSAIFSSANFSIIATDANGVIQLFNVGAQRMLGYTAADVMNKITPADISDPQEVIARARDLSLELSTTITPGFEALVFKASRGIEDIYELTYFRKDKSRFPAVVSVTALRDAQDAIIGYLLIGTDNTARKQAEEALSKAGALQSAIFNSANFSSIATDARGVIQIFNVGAERMLGYTAADVMNKITPADISDPRELIARATALSVELGTPITPGFEALVFKASRGIEDIYELTYIRKDSSRFPAVVSVTALRDAQDAIIGYLLIGTDNTARKLVEAEIERARLQLTGQNQRLVALTEQAHRFVDDVSHEFRTPLAVIKEFGAIIADGLAGPITPEQGQYLGIIDNGVLDLNQMVEDFLDSSKLRAGLLRVDRCPQRIDDLFARIRPGLQKKAASRSITVIERIDPDLPLAFADEEKVRRVIMNLATNAVKFSPEKSQIELWARRAAEGGVEVGVTDQGRGLTPGDLALLFKRFRQLPNSDAPSLKGFGLGLNIARQLVWLNLGNMNVVSDPGRGSTFSFTLPTDDPRMIVDRFFMRLAECEDVAPSVAVISITPVGPAESLDALRLFLAATTRPTDVILDMPSPAGNGLLVLGPTESAEGWASRLSCVRERAVNDAGATRLGPFRIEILGTFAYPERALDATACALDRLAQEPTHV
ncbi:MAG: PAS domain S-box protein [Planctomycetota bacterium]